MNAADAGTVVIVFARAPSPGAVKTRLISVLGAVGAATLHARLAGRTLETVHSASLARIELHGTPDIEHPFLRSSAARFATTLATQTGTDLGARMRAAFESVLARHPRALLVGTDCPALAVRHLREADQALRDGADAVFVPCEDGGYALIGLRRTDAQLFEDIRWGSATVMADTRARLAALGWTWRELETLWDVDRPEDYERLVASGLINDGPSRGTSFPRRRESSHK